MQRREQFRNAVLNYLDEESQVGQRAQFDRKARLMRNRFGSDVDPNAGSSVAAQARARTNQRMATKRFGQGAFAAAGNTAAAQAASDRQMRQTSKRFQGRAGLTFGKDPDDVTKREQFKNAVLNYLDETSLELKTAVSTARSMRNRSIPGVQLNTTKPDYDPEKVKDQDRRDTQEIKNNARMSKAAVDELKPKPRSDEERSKDDPNLAKERKRLNDLQDDGYSHNTQSKSKVKLTQPKHSFLARFKRLVQSPKKPK